MRKKREETEAERQAGVKEKKEILNGKERGKGKKHETKFVKRIECVFWEEKRESESWVRGKN